MTIDELKASVEKYRQGCKEKDGKVVMFSDTGPVGMGLIDKIVAVLERQQSEIDQLKSARGK